ncbi:MAG: hypothetical protein WBB42_01490 [Polyangiales bacterium]
MNARSSVIAVASLAIPTLCAWLWVSAASARLDQVALESDAPQVAVAASTDADYCSPELKKILRRVLQSCGLLGSNGGRGCQPLQARNVASMSGSDFNALFTPMKDRGGIVQFDAENSALDPQDEQLIADVFSDQRGAAYFLIVARASPDGEIGYNRDLSERRAEAVMKHLHQTFNDPDLEREVGLLWLGEEFAQLEREFCDWTRSEDGSTCNTTQINRGAFLAWIDCQL